jgi:hypothetical protein
VENTPMKKTSLVLNTSIRSSSSKEIIEETPVKEEEIENENISSDKMTRDIQRLNHRLRSSIPCKEIRKTIFISLEFFLFSV